MRPRLEQIRSFVHPISVARSGRPGFDIELWAPMIGQVSVNLVGPDRGEGALAGGWDNQVSASIGCALVASLQKKRDEINRIAEEIGLQIHGKTAEAA